MRLPSALYEAIKKHMAGHGWWHLARVPKWLVPEGAEADWKHARTLYPYALPFDQRGSGRQFLEFHRHMLRHFRGLLQMQPPPQYVFTPWSQLPSWLSKRFAFEYLRAFEQRTEHLMHHGSDDALGLFIEGEWVDTSLGAGFHNRAHGTIAKYEFDTVVDRSKLDDAQMDNFSTAHHNEHFWTLHEWIDERFARWQYIHGEPVERGPLTHHMHREIHPVFAPTADPKVFSPSQATTDFMRILLASAGSFRCPSDLIRATLSQRTKAD